MKALVKPSTEPYNEVLIESDWGTWTKNNLDMYTECYGYSLIENYEPTPDPEPIAV